MSAVKSMLLDVRAARKAGRAAASKASACDRLAEYRAVCASLGEIANGYAVPMEAARALVSVAARAFQVELKNTRKVESK